jgi:hypothetical protein
MKFRNLVGLAALGGLLYAHKRHGGEWNAASFKRSARDLMSAIQHGSRRAAETAKEYAERAQHKAQEVTEEVASRADEVSRAAEETFSGDGNVR